MVRGSAREHHGAHDCYRHQPCGEGTRTVAIGVLDIGRILGATWRRSVRSGRRPPARILGSCAIRWRITAISWVSTSTGPRLRSAPVCLLADGRSTRSWLRGRVRCGPPSWRFAHGSSFPRPAGSAWLPISSGSSRRQSERLRRRRLPYPFRDARSSKRKRGCSVSQFVWAANDRCTREGWRCCRCCSAMAAVRPTTRIPGRLCSMRFELPPLASTADGLPDARLDRASPQLRRVASGT
jgi:hypothetical protein